ncbi:MAG: hypothetical protein Q4D76_13020 [Oscillospiraceae bacterium]|nr:hypothetical protein [Oscillospiraceae bacterium]
MDKMALELKNIFFKANKRLLDIDSDLFISQVAERTLCGALKQHLDFYIPKSRFSGYYIDVEYNRNKNGKVKTCCPFDEDGIPKPVTINCDLIVHSRGNNIEQDNLIAIEMKKYNRPRKEKENDRRRLIALTKDKYDDIWSYDGTTLPEHVCRYKIGIYYEINYKKRTILLEYYYRGKLDCEEIVGFCL